MKQREQAKNWHWLCMQSVSGMKCNRGKFPIRKGTCFDNSKKSIQDILRIGWNIVHKLNTKQSQQFRGLSAKTNHTVVEFYDAVEPFAQDGFGIQRTRQSSVGLGRLLRWMNLISQACRNITEDADLARLGKTMTDCILKQVLLARNRKMLHPIIQTL